MIDVKLTHNSSGQLIGFTVKNHGTTHVCAAVSMLVINTVNSIESLTSIGAKGFDCNYNESGGFLTFMLKNHDRNPQAGLLLDALKLGLASVKQEYPTEIDIKE